MIRKQGLEGIDEGQARAYRTAQRMVSDFGGLAALDDDVLHHTGPGPAVSCRSHVFGGTQST